MSVHRSSATIDNPALMGKHRQNSSLLKPDHNCWRIEHAARAAFLVDGADYFAALRAAARGARRSIWIVAWDIDSRVRLVPDGAKDDLPEELGDFLNELAERSPDLEIRILDWDFAMVYATEREFLPIYKFGWRTNERVHFHLDDLHPVGASQHQKIVVIDDAIAFVGGLDLAQCRWDTSEHSPKHPHRFHANGEPCDPFHDIQMAVDGDVAAALSDLVRERWERATGTPHPRNQSKTPYDPWPPELKPDLTDVDVAICRTQCEYESYSQVQEIKNLYLDAISAAQDRLYLENQYFSSGTIADALTKRIAEKDGPEVMLISRKHNHGWLEESTIGVLRARLHQQLQSANGNGHYGAYYPDAKGLGNGMINVHSKLMIMDDQLVTIGSANLTNRSFGLDSECNLVIEAGGDNRIQSAIAALRHRLLAEHLGVNPDEIADAERQGERMLSHVKRFEGRSRTLKPLNPVVSAEIDGLLPSGEYLDPEKPAPPEQLVNEFVKSEQHTPAKRRLLGFSLALVVLFGLAAAWRWTPLSQWLDLDSLLRFAEVVQAAPATPLLVLGAFVVAGLLILPVTAVTIVTALIFGPVLALFYAIVGAALSAAVTYLMGRMLGRNTIQRMAGSRINRLSRQLGERGIIAIIVVRIVPVAPFTIVNMVAGASHIRFRDYLLGTVLGMAPGTIAIVLFIDRIVAAMRNPSPSTFGILGAVAAVIVVGALAIRYWLRRRRSQRPNSSVT